MKALNVLGIVFAWILSIALVIMLVAAPLLLSSLSVLDTENIINIVSRSLLDGQKSADTALEKEYTFQKLSVSSEKKSLTNRVLDIVNLEDIEKIIGEKIDEKVVAEVLASDAVTEIFKAYANDVANVLTGENGERQFTSQTIVELVQNNLDEIVGIVENAGVSMSAEQKEELKSKITTVVKENADKIVDALPAPEEIAETLVKDNKTAAMLAAIFVKKNTVKAVLVGVIVVLSLLIFALRYPGFRGLRWLASDLFTAGGINAILCLALGVGATTIIGLIGGVDGTPLGGMAEKLLTQLTTGIAIRTAIMLVAAALLLVAYLLLKKRLQAKRMKTAAALPSAENEA